MLNLTAGIDNTTSGYTADAGWTVLSDGGRPMLLTFDEGTGHRGRAVIVGDEDSQ